MYKDAFGLTENENLFDTISIKRMIEVIKNPDVEVTNVSRSTNNYGEFVFISLRNPKTKDAIFFYTFGYHELLNTYLLEKAKTGLGNYYDYDKKMDKKVALRKIMSFQKQAKKDAKKYSKEKHEPRDIMDMEMEELEEIGFI